MRTRATIRIAVIVVAMVVLFVGLATTVSSEPGNGFQPCPQPACAAPCVFGQPPQVLCKTPGGGPPVETTFACCCCGSGEGSFKPL
jgi:hypothetical protein